MRQIRLALRKASLYWSYPACANWGAQPFVCGSDGVGNLVWAQKAAQVQTLQATLQKEASPSEVGSASPDASSTTPQEERTFSTTPSLRSATLKEEVAEPTPLSSPQQEPTPAIQLQPALKKETKPE